MTFFNLFKHFLANSISVSFLTVGMARMVFADEITQVSSLAEALRSAGKGSLIAIDIDLTLLVQDQDLGTDLWFSQFRDELIQTGHTRAEAIAKAQMYFRTINRVSKVRSIEASATADILLLQEKGISLIGATARPVANAEITFRQLQDVGIDFTRTAPLLKLVDLGDTAHAVGGVIFSDFAGKGYALTQYLRRLEKNKTITDVIFIDDKKEHLESVGAAMREIGIPFKGWHYTKALQHVTNFDYALAKIQFEYFCRTGKLLSNPEAHLIRSCDDQIWR